MIEIRMRMPDGNASLIRVERTLKGVDLHISRPPFVGDVKLPAAIAQRLADAIVAELAKEPA